MHALDTVIALIVGENMVIVLENSNNGKQIFLRHLLGFSTFEEEKAFNQISQENYHLCNVSRSLPMRIGNKKFTSLLRHGSTSRRRCIQMEQSTCIVFLIVAKVMLIL